MAKMSALVAFLSGMSDSTHVEGQCEYFDINGNYSAVNFSVAIGLTLPLFNLSLAAFVANDCNSQFGTSWASTDVVMFGGPSLLAT